MTIRFPDIASYQKGISLRGVPAVAIKATQGTNYINPDFAPALGRAASAGAFPFAYHFLVRANGAGQADFCYAKVGKLPLMLDFEPTKNSNPSVSDGLAFIDRFRQRGGTVRLLYLPRWYWLNLSSPSLKPFADRGMALVSSDYGVAYTDSPSGRGWLSYGGMTPVIWQYTSTASLNGYYPVDFNAYRGTLDQLISLVTGAKADPVISRGATGDAVRKLQARLNLWGAKLTVDGDFGPRTHSAVLAFQKAHGLAIDGIVGPVTWRHLNEAPPSQPKPNPGHTVP